MSTDLELRILSGLHAQARCPARDGALIGADPDCDVVLADTGITPRMARLAVSASGWRLDREDGAAEDAGDWQHNVARQLGTVWLTVSRPGDPWPVVPAAAGTPRDEGPDDALLAGPALVIAETQAGRPSPEAASSGGAAAGSASSSAAAAGAAASSRPAARSRTLSPIIACAVAVALLAIVLMALLAPPSTPAPKPAEPLSSEQSLGRIQAAIERLGLSSRLHVAMTPNGAARVTGWVRNTAERDALASALSQIWPMPAMRVSIEEDAVRTARDTLAGFSVRFDPRYDGDGRMTLLGVAASARERASALDAVRAQLPGITIMGHQIALAPDVADALTARLAEAGLSGTVLSWRPDRLEATPPAGLNDEGMTRLKALLDDFNAEYSGVATLSREAAERPVADRVPFTIRSVVGGPQPFIVLGDGSKLLVGGVHQQYRLTAIENDRLVFEGPRPAVVLR